MTTNILARLKDEYCQALVERMTAKEMREYLIQIFSNDVAYDNMDEMQRKIERIFDKEFFEQLILDISTEIHRSSKKKSRLSVVE